MQDAVIISVDKRESGMFVILNLSWLNHPFPLTVLRSGQKGRSPPFALWV